MSDSQSILSSVLELGRDLPSQELPSFLGKLEEIRVTALARLQTPAAQAKQEDRLLNTAEAAERLGVSEHYLRRHPELPFLRRVGRRVLYSSAGIQRFIEQKR